MKHAYRIAAVLALIAVAAPVALAYRTTTQDTYLYNLARKTYLTWEELLPDQRADMLNKADSYQVNINAWNTPYDQIADVWYTSYTPADPYADAYWYEQIGDGATHTGEYLAGLCAKYAVTGEAATLTDINTYLDTYEMLSRCSGKNGYIVRFAGPSTDPAYQRYYQPYGNGYGNCVAPWTGWIWLDYSSRDTYFGSAFGLGSVWVNVADPATRDKARVIIERVADCLNADGWWIKSPTGKNTNYTYGFKLVWMRLALSVNPTKYAGWQSAYDSTYNTWKSLGKPNVSNKYASDYYAQNLNWMYMYLICKLETNATKLSTYRSHLSTMFKTQNIDHLQALNAGIYAAGYPDSTYAQARATAQGMLLEYPAPPRWIHYTDQSTNPLYQPAYNSTLSKYAIHRIEDRPTDIYMWQRTPCKYRGGADGSYMHPGTDFFTAYWFGRLGGVIPAP